jgi:hypothetical protein
LAGLVPAIHVLGAEKDEVDARHQAGHDEPRGSAPKPAEKSLHFLVIFPLWG